MKVLVIGGTGFSGPHVVRRLHAQGHDVVLFHRGRTRTELPPGVDEIVGDRDELRSHGSRLRALRPDVVLHMIAMAERHGRDLVQTFRGAAGRVVVISSEDVYLPYGRLWKVEPGPPVPVPLTEDGPLRTVLFPHKGATAVIFKKFRERASRVRQDPGRAGRARRPGTTRHRSALAGGPRPGGPAAPAVRLAQTDGRPTPGDPTR